MIDVHYWPTPNGWKVTIMLEECELPYRIVPVDIGAGDQFTAEFLRLSPNNRMPAIVDHDPIGGGKPISIFESGAILEYLADKTGKFLPTAVPERFRVLQWVYWQVANLGPMMGNLFHFKNYAKHLTSDTGQLDYALKRFGGEVDRLASVMDAQLQAHEFLAGTDYTIADIASWPWSLAMRRVLGEDAMKSFPNLQRWIEHVGARQAAQRGRAAGRELGERQYSEEEQRARRQFLFNQDSEKVRKAREAAAQRSS